MRPSRNATDAAGRSPRKNAPMQLLTLPPARSSAHVHIHGKNRVVPIPPESEVIVCVEQFSRRVGCSCWGFLGRWSDGVISMKKDAGHGAGAPYPCSW
jgi:hypothetical protein